MPQPFRKMHGLGNDFVVFDARGGAVAMSAARARAIADRHFGVGCDQLVLIEPSDVATARMRIWNADGGEVESCGNATRCVATLLGDGATIETLGGVLDASVTIDGASVDMGAPRFEWDAVPLAYAMDTLALPLAWGGVETIAPPMALSVGNPHVILFVADADALDIEALGRPIENDPIFPERVNVNFATIESRTRIRLRVWERGSGATLACGTGACATAVAAIRAGRAKSGVTVALSGGDLVIDWQPGGTIRMTGPATHVFSGEIDLAAFPA
ncbi:diaminopimelate epimerase [Sphingomonas sp. CGMCC 1.13654]|uniref:Diaminopimelate epimerase n=1 Tax=Sphingomonas chungangi TaxID=2683589 RepID=A0A838LAS0_9SPHN|nr:diaminopimelate epimerase [Sphingomonas chungangi]MBA2936304.1 diaminopimelate epimerase [Sphingomonas chungangi]MVW55689.1 diaminopimelate epimerase [Sphingomonas chungangi]